jgi:lysophospholipase L1-like esterase
MKTPRWFMLAATLIVATQSEARPRNDRVLAPAQPALEAAAAWTEDGDNGGAIMVSRRANGVWNTPEAVTDGRHGDFLPSLDITTDGTGWAVWVRRTGDQRLLFVSRFDGKRWSAPEPIETGMAVNMAPAVEVDARGTPTVAWAGLEGDDDIYVSRREGGRWTAPTRLHTDNGTPDILPEASFDAQGRVVVSWQHADRTGYTPYRAVPTTAGWSCRPNVDAAGDAAHARERVNALCAGAPFRRKALDTVVLIDPGPRRHSVRLTTLAALAPRAAPSAGATERSESRWLIVCFGDSITQGYPYITSPGNGSTAGGYEIFLAALLARAGQPADVLNYGKGGENTFQGVERFELLPSTQPNADFVLIMEGTNDANGGLSYTSVLYNLDLMVQMALQAGIEPVISTLLPSSKDETDDIPRLFNPGIRTIAANRQIRLCDPYSIFDQYFGILLPDGVHPNWLGYLVLGYYWELALLAV